MAGDKMTLVELLRNPERETNGSLGARVEMDMTNGAESIEALQASLNEMLDVYWGEGDGEIRLPRCIHNARAALALLK